MQEDNHEIVRFYIDRNHYYEGKASVISKTGAGSITLEGYAYLDFAEGDYIQTKEIMKGKIVRIIPTEETDRWGMALPKAEINILDGQTIIVPLTMLEKQRK